MVEWYEHYNSYGFKYNIYALIGSDRRDEFIAEGPGSARSPPPHYPVTEYGGGIEELANKLVIFNMGSWRRTSRHWAIPESRSFFRSVCKLAFIGISLCLGEMGVG